MKRSIFAFTLFAGLVAGAMTSDSAQAGGDDSAAIQLSLIFPGAGEWYNAGFSGGFPLVECILGNICPCVRISSLIDAAAGKTDDGVRFDFWASPN